jgi:hypothetical protein
MSESNASLIEQIQKGKVTDEFYRSYRQHVRQLRQEAAAVINEMAGPEGKELIEFAEPGIELLSKSALQARIDAMTTRERIDFAREVVGAR